MAPESRTDLDQLRKWPALLHRRRPSPAAQNRWTLWARSFATRHLRLVAGRDPLDLVVVHPRRLVRILRERWLVTPRRVRPRIELSIHSILNLTVNQRHSVSHEGAQSTYFSSRDFFFRSAPAVAQRLGKVSGPEKDFEKLSLHNPAEAVFNASTPLTMVFNRVWETQKLSHFRTMELLMDQRERSIAKRIARRSRRDETMVTTVPNLPGLQSATTETEAIQSHSMKLAPLSKLTPAAVKVFERSVTTREAKMESTSWQREDSATLLPDLNLEQITDQVVRRLDHRVVGLRERMGRI